ncbi:MAG TPA: hypothetical protein VHJ83_08610 [Micromonosporaceae bacterium]|nr:hypothetical protein [Micromonosporaceae bacterium]
MARRSNTRVLFGYGLAGRSVTDPATTMALSDVFEYGRFTPHLEAADQLMPRVRLLERLAGDVLGTRDGAVLPEFAELRVLVLVTPRGDMVLLLDGVIAGEPEAESIVSLLAVTCFNRTELTLDGEPVLDWLGRRLGHSARPRFGRDVHQVVSPGGDLLVETLSGTPDQVPAVVTDLIYRGTLPLGSGLTVRTPRVVNNPGHTAVIHARGVSVVAGWDEPVENALSTGAVLLISALGVLRRARHQAFDALARNEHAMLLSTSDARSLVSELSSQLNELQLDLSFGVEAYIDSLVIPEIVIESFQVSLREGLGLTDALGNTSRMLDRLQSVISARVSALAAAAQEQEEQRQRVISTVIAVGSLFALPPGLLLAFFGVNALEVDQSASIFDLGRYWPAYALAWLPFLALVTAGFLPLWRLRSRSAQLRIHSGKARHGIHGSDPVVPSRPDNPVRLPAPRLNPGDLNPGDTAATAARTSGREPT